MIKKLLILTALASCIAHCTHESLVVQAQLQVLHDEALVFKAQIMRQEKATTENLEPIAFKKFNLDLLNLKLQFWKKHQEIEILAAQTGGCDDLQEHYTLEEIERSITRLTNQIKNSHF